MNYQSDPLAEAIRSLQRAGAAAGPQNEAEMVAVAPHLLHEARHCDEDVAAAAVTGFCVRLLRRLLGQHGHAPEVCAKVVRANFHRLLRWRQRDVWRKNAQRRRAEQEFAAGQVRDAYEGETVLDTEAVMRVVAGMDHEVARLLPCSGEARSLDEIHANLAASLRCSKATVRRRLLSMRLRLRARIRRDTGEFVVRRPASHLPAARGVCASRVTAAVLAAA